MQSFFIFCLLLFSTPLLGQNLEGEFEIEISTSAWWGISLNMEGQYTYFISPFRRFNLKRSTLEKGTYSIKDSIISFYPDTLNPKESLSKTQFRLHKTELKDYQTIPSFYPSTKVINSPNIYWVLSSPGLLIIKL